LNDNGYSHSIKSVINFPHEQQVIATQNFMWIVFPLLKFDAAVTCSHR